jgi:predicted AAA+ superfamily ATPase
MHSGVGRIYTLGMRPMSLFESGDSSGEVSLRSLFDAPPAPVPLRQPSVREIAGLVVRGGWPEALGRAEGEARMLAEGYLRLTAEDDASRLDGVRRDSAKLSSLIRSLARNESTLAKNSTLRRDMLEFDDETISSDTVADYLSVLGRLFVIWEQPAFDPNLRSSVRVGKSPKRHLADPSLAVATLQMNERSLRRDWQTFGLVFENLCVRDLLVYARALPDAAEDPVHYYRDDSGLEVDAIIELSDGRWAAIEVKTSEEKANEGLATFRRLKRKLTANPASRVRPPEFVAVVVGISEFAREVGDCEYVLPIRCLGA